MTKLALTVPLGTNETPTSYASRLAAYNCVSGRLLAQDFDFNFQKIADGDHSEIRRLAALGGVDADALIAHAVMKAGTGFELRGQLIAKRFMRRGRVTICPHCIKEDIEASDLPPDCAAYGRSEWSVGPIRTCENHSVPLVTVAEGLSPGELHDFARNIAPAIPRIDDLLAESRLRPTSGLEHYLLRRLDGHNGHAWLDAMPFFAAVSTTEIVGAVVTHGKRVNMDSLNEDDWQQAGAAGFESLRDGAASLNDLMRQMDEDHVPKKSGSGDGPQAVYGKLYINFAHGLSDPAYDPVRAVMAEHILGRFPLGPGDELFRKPVEHRRFHSIRTASLAYDMHPKRLRKLVEAEGLITDATLHDRDVLFDAEVADRLFQRKADQLTLKEVEKYINAPRPMSKVLYEAGLIQRRNLGAGMNEVYLKSELDVFVAGLYADAAVVDTPGPGVLDVAAAAKRTNASIADVIRLIRDGKLHWIGRKIDGHGVLGILVNLEEVRRHTRLPELSGAAPADCLRILRINWKVMRRLLDVGVFQTVTERHPIKRNPQTVIPYSEIERFQKTYISLFTLARESGRHMPDVRRELLARNVKVAFDVDVGATFYLRSDLK